MYIILSSLKFKTKNILSKQLSLLFGNFQLINVEPFDIKASANYLEHRLGQERLNKGLSDFLVHFTGGYPFYLEVITDALLKSKDRNDLAGLIESLLFETSGILNQRFSNYFKRFMDLCPNPEYASMLYLVSSGQNKIKDIAHILRKTKKEIEARIGHLLELDIISRLGDFLKINDRVFSFWMKFVYQGKLQSLTFDARNQKDLFRSSIEGLIKEFLESRERPVIERISEILGLFKDDSVQIERKKIRLEHFKEIKPLEFNTAGLREGIIARTKESLWIMTFKDERLSEEDIAGFSRECKKFRNKLERKIIITSQGIDSNARLRALEEKILTWDLNNLNQLLDLFAKPRVIV